MLGRVVLAGASGPIGRALASSLGADGYKVGRLVRRPPAGPDEATWDPDRGVLSPDALDGAAAVVNLAGRSIAGESLFGGRWTARVRAEILDSRVRSTRLIVETLNRLSARPAVLVSASAIGYYGNRGDETLTETSTPGRGFLAEVANAWEAEAMRASALGVRVVRTRFGLILAREGGTLDRLLPMFRLGLGGWLGSGRQWWSWIHLDDVIGAITMAIRTPALEGPVNVVGPAPVSNRAFTRALAAALHRPAILPVPAFALRLVLGGMANEMVLSSQRVLPARLQAAGFAFRWPDLGPALKDLAAPKAGRA